MADVNSNNLSVYGQTSDLSSVLFGTYGYHDVPAAGDNKITNHAERAVNLLIEQFRKKAQNLISVLRIFGNSVQLVEDTESDLLTLRSVSSATGQQLDNIGEIVGQPRGDVTNDETYRNNILIRIFINSFSGTPEALISAMRLTTNATRVQYKELYPAAVYIFTNGINGVNSELKTILDNIAPGGVQVFPVQLDFTKEQFTFASESGISVDGKGFSEWDVTGGDTDYWLDTEGNRVGGQFVELYH